MAQALDTSESIGGFTLVDVIGRGGFGITYRASEAATGNIYAIKEYLPEDLSARLPNGTVRPQPGTEEEFQRGLTAFLDEANILKDLPTRKGLVRVRGAFEKFDTAYCVMEFIEGDSLDRMSKRTIARHNHVPANLVEELAISVCWALDALHAENLIHRDVKPGNVMLRRSGEPVLIDFGAARKLSRGREKHVILTRRYAAIEQFPSDMTGFGREFDEGPWTDLYALSIVLYELITQEIPADAMARSAAVLGGRGDPLTPLTDRQLPGHYPNALLQAVDKGCALMPRARYQSAREMAEAIRPGVWADLQNTPARSAPEPVKPIPPVRPKTRPRPDPPPPLPDEVRTGPVRRRKRGFFWVVLLIVAAALVGGAWIYSALFPNEVF